MSRLEKKLSIIAIAFVVVYIGAVVLTLHSRGTIKDGATRIESAESAPGEGHLMLAELFLPMLIVFSVTICFIIVKKKRDKARPFIEDVGESRHHDNC